VPLVSLTGLWQLPVFFGKSQPHQCLENGSIVMEINDTTCTMENTYLTEFGLYCEKETGLTKFNKNRKFREKYKKLGIGN